jgi:hypothetical protein
MIIGVIITHMEMFKKTYRIRVILESNHGGITDKFIVPCCIFFRDMPVVPMVYRVRDRGTTTVIIRTHMLFDVILFQVLGLNRNT